MEKRTLYLLVGLVAALIGLVLLAGCMSGPEVSYDYRISQPYDAKSGVIEMRVNVTASVLTNNSGGGDLRFTVEKASMSAYFDDGSSETVEAEPTSGFVPASGYAETNLTFNGVPVRYVLLDGPARFHSLIRYYDVNVTYSGQKKLLFIWSPVERSARNVRIPLGDMPVGDYFSRMIGELNLGSA